MTKEYGFCKVSSEYFGILLRLMFFGRVVRITDLIANLWKFGKKITRSVQALRVIFSSIKTQPFLQKSSKDDVEFLLKSKVSLTRASGQRSLISFAVCSGPLPPWVQKGRIVLPSKS